jgi:uncharacterized protein (TIGR03435 family)
VKPILWDHDFVVLAWSKARVAILGTLLFQASIVFPQLPSTSRPFPSFEVATIRPSKAESSGASFQVAPMRFRVVSGTLTDLITFAYDVRSSEQLQQKPHWIDAERFDVDAKIDDAQAAATKSLEPSKQIDQYRLMVQSLLKERFGLTVHRQTKELQVYALEAAKGGPKLTSSTAPSSLPTLSGWSQGMVDAHAATMSLLSEGLSGRDEVGGRVVIDASGLKGSYDFTLQWTPPRSSDRGSNVDEVPLTTALREQLGLKLVARKAPAPVLVIDHVEHLTPN